MTTLKPGTIVKEKGLSGHYTILEGGKVFVHTANAVLHYVRASDFERWIKDGTAEIVHPKPEREPKVGDVIKWNSGSVYTITSDDNFFDHRNGEVLDLSHDSATEYCKRHSGAWSFAN